VTAPAWPLPDFLAGRVDQATYTRWLRRKATAHWRRDRARGHDCACEAYRQAIHAAVLASNGRDAYTGEPLDWELISRYRNDRSAEGRHAYRRGFALLPTVDHVDADALQASFRICGWRTNDAKNDLSPAAFIELCRAVLVHAGYDVRPRETAGKA
jgi:hypothetical protein